MEQVLVALPGLLVSVEPQAEGGRPLLEAHVQLQLEEVPAVLPQDLLLAGQGQRPASHRPGSPLPRRRPGRCPAWRSPRCRPPAGRAGGAQRCPPTGRPPCRCPPLWWAPSPGDSACRPWQRCGPRNRHGRRRRRPWGRARGQVHRAAHAVDHLAAVAVFRDDVVPPTVHVEQIGHLVHGIKAGGPEIPPELPVLQVLRGELHRAAGLLGLGARLSARRRCTGTAPLPDPKSQRGHASR